MKKILNFSFIRLRMLPANSRPRDVAGHFVQIQSNLQPLLAGHLAVAFNLFDESGCRRHRAIMAALLQRSKIIQPGVGATRRVVAGRRRERLRRVARWE